MYSLTITQVKEPISHQLFKHILRRYHPIQEIIDKGYMKIGKVPSLENVTNHRQRYLCMRTMMDILNIWVLSVCLIDSSTSGRLLM